MVSGPIEEPTAKLLDFGLARLPGGSTTVALQGVDRRLPYRDPNYPRDGSRGDQFSLGVILYELVTLAGPYPPEKYVEFQNSQLEGRELSKSLNPLSHLMPQGRSVRRSFEDILTRMVQFRTADRYPRWEELIVALEKVLQAAG